MRIATSPPKLDPASPIRAYPRDRTRATAASACSTARETVMSSNRPSLSPCPKKSKRNVAIPASFSILVKALLVVLFLLERKPWQSTTTPWAGGEGPLKTAEIRRPLASWNASSSSMRPHCRAECIGEARGGRTRFGLNARDNRRCPGATSRNESDQADLDGGPFCHANFS